MPAKKRTSKRLPRDELSFHQLLDLQIGRGRLGRDGVDGRVGRLWESEDDKEAAYWAHKGRVLR